MADKWVVFTQVHCPWCDLAKKLLDEKGIPFAPYYVDLAPSFKGLMRDMGLDTVPQVYHNGMRVGGYEDLVRYLRRET